MGLFIDGAMNFLHEKMFHFIVPRELQNVRLEESIRLIDKNMGDKKAQKEEKCIFILSAGWRSGSTLLQRLLCSDSRVLIWGEPLADAIPIQRLAAIIDAAASQNEFRMETSYDNFLTQKIALSGSFIANLHPGFSSLYLSHKAFIDNFLAKPALEKGYSIWGAKEVRLTAHHAFYLRWLYPQAKFIFLVRNPIDAYKSYKGFKWYSVGLVSRVDNIWKFISHWLLIAKSFISEREKLNALIVRYEDLIDHEEILRISDFCDLKIDPAVLDIKIRGVPKDVSSISGIEKAIIKCVAFPVLKFFGY